MKRILAVLLCLCMAAAWLPLGATAAQTDLTAAIEEQIRAFADSIDKPNADDDAAWALASHGMFKGGKKLSVGKSHALTATLMNSEMMQDGLIESCTSAILAMQQLDRAQLDQVYGCGYWQGLGESYFYARVYDTDSAQIEHLDWMLTDIWNRAGERNAYDEALDWIAGFASLEMAFSRTKVTADSVTYKVTLMVSDRFDFETRGNSLFQDLISGIGALLFKEFEWESKVSFDLTVPYECSHSSGNYHWTYDPQSHTLTGDGSDGFRANGAYRHTYTYSGVDDTYYHELEEPIRLIHDKPWVMEYHVQDPGVFNMSPLNDTSTSHPFLKMHGRRYIAVGDRERILLPEEDAEEYGAENSSVYHYYGTTLMEHFSFTTQKIYTIRLENQVDADGGNMIYVSVRDTASGALLLERTPLDDHIKSESWNGSEVCVSEADEWISGKDLYISYIGNKTYRLGPDHFELWVWENGEDGASFDYYEISAVTAPTCVKKGYTTYTCSACGHSKKTDYVDAAGHSWGQWEVISETLRQRSCTVCGEVEQEAISIRYGDANSDGSVDALDLILLRQYLAGWAVSLNGVSADANSDGSADALDLILLRQYLAGWDVVLGP